ncbi:arginine/serine-rich coiled-coil protein 2 isoform X3 [Punica granatum]|nr:arginine/serine-rich coiled-coil protein 2 isoform X3 [Punica granatum]XP_031383509.1 arginine/serine-rich coiled-coil protein 2 isoform X3 [Punica granatum]
MESSPPENSSDMKAAFRKPSNDASKRNYRRRSPTDGSSSSDVELQHGHSPSSKYCKEDAVKGHDYRERKKDDDKDLTRDSSRSHHGKSGDSYRYSDRHSSRSSYSHSRHDDHRRRESDHSRSRDYMRDRDKYSRDRYESTGHRSKDKEKETSSLERQNYRDKESHRSDSVRRKSNFEESERDQTDWDRDDRGEKREYRRSSRDRRSGWDKEESKGHPTARKDRDDQKLSKEMRGFEDSGSVNDKDRFDRGFRKPLDDKSIFEGEGNSPTKKPRLFSSHGGSDLGEDVDGGKQQSQEVNGKATTQANVSASEAANNLDAAKFAAMRAAELVNRNLAGGAGYMSTEQKKKLLWGNKKSTTTEESSHHWDVSMIADPERQEKFNKLMSLRLCWYLWPIVGCEGRGEVFGTKARERRWEQPNPSREAEGAAVESREAVHSWASKKGRPDCWVRPLRIRLKSLTGHFLLNAFVGVVSLLGLCSWGGSPSVYVHGMSTTIMLLVLKKKIRY